MTAEKDRHLQALVKRLAEAERECIRAKLRFTSYERRAKWAGCMRKLDMKYHASYFRLFLEYVGLLLKAPVARTTYDNTTAMGQ